MVYAHSRQNEMITQGLRLGGNLSCGQRKSDVKRLLSELLGYFSRNLLDRYSWHPESLSGLFTIRSRRLDTCLYCMLGLRN